MKYLSGTFEINNNNWCSCSQDIATVEKDGIVIETLGYLQLEDGMDIIGLYRSFGIHLTEHLNGSYLLMVYDKPQQCAMIFQDRMTSPVNVYYTIINNAVYYATSLKVLLASSQIHREMNEDVIEEFLVNGYLYGEATLLRNVFKLKPEHALQIDKYGVKQIPVSYPNSQLRPGEALENWEGELDAAIERRCYDLDEISLPISSGYDSNYILHVANRQGKPVHAFSIGGEFGKNELPLVKENMKAYPNVQLHTALTTANTLQNLPDIVWSLEGAVYESGVFLQYELAKLVQEANKSCLICGECADQIMNLHFPDAERRKAQAPGTYYPFDEYPYIFGSQLILKKNGILFNSFGIETRYPFYDEHFVAVAKALAPINGKDKRCHVAHCRKVLPPEVIANISKIGGSTEFHSLFRSDDERKSLLKWIESSSFYQRHQALIRKHSYLESQRQHGLAKYKTAIRNIILQTLHIGNESRRKNAYFMEEMELRDALCVLYLILFEKLFVGKGINDFNAACPASLQDMIK